MVVYKVYDFQGENDLPMTGNNELSIKLHYISDCFSIFE